jgi:hypothetical protein
MSTPRQNLNLTWRRWLRATIESVTLMGAAEQTRLSWAKSVRAIDEIPPFYLEYLHSSLPGLDACLPAVLTPTFRGFLRRENEKLVFIHAERLYILEQTAPGLLAAVFPIAEINYVEVGAILLKAWLRVSGLIDGQLASQTLKYNTVTQFLFDPMVSNLRCTLSEAERSRRAEADLRLERARFDPLRDEFFKFMSYARKSLQPGERVLDYLMQPEIRTPRLNILGRTMAMRTIDTAHLCILTDSELIVIRDDPTSLQSWDDTRYGGVWNYLPRSRIQHATLEERADSLALVLRLSGDERFEVLFASDRRLAVERLCALLRAGIPIR